MAGSQRDTYSAASAIVHPVLLGIWTEWATSDRLEQDEACYALRRSGCGERGLAGRGEHTDQRGRAHPDGVHDGEDVVGVLFEGRDVPDSLGEPKAARLHVDRAREGRTPLVHLVDVRVGPAQVEMLGGLADHEHIYAAVADNLIRELGSVSLYVLCFGSVHTGRLDPDARHRRQRDQQLVLRTDRQALERPAPAVDDGRSPQNPPMSRSPAKCCNVAPAIAAWCSICPDSSRGCERRLVEIVAPQRGEQQRTERS